MGLAAEPLIALVYDDDAYVEAAGPRRGADGPPGGGSVTSSTPT